MVKLIIGRDVTHTSGSQHWQINVPKEKWPEIAKILNKPWGEAACEIDEALKDLYDDMEIIYEDVEVLSTQYDGYWEVESEGK